MIQFEIGKPITLSQYQRALGQNYQFRNVSKVAKVATTFHPQGTGEKTTLRCSKHPGNRNGCSLWRFPVKSQSEFFVELKSGCLTRDETNVLVNIVVHVNMELILLCEYYFPLL